MAEATGHILAGTEPGHGPLRGLKFVEMAGIGPAPFACMMLADLGATGVRIESPRPGLSVGSPEHDITRRGRRSLTVDMSLPQGRQLILDLIANADLLVDGFRPGVMERRSLGPTECLEQQPRLVYGRMTGWGQEGPYATVAGHDLTYLAAAGVLAHVGRLDQPPTPPLNLVADYGGGAMLLLVGVLSALWEAQRTGRGQVVDAAMIDGAALLMSMFHSMRNQGTWSMERGVNLLDSGAPFYDVYRTSDDGWLALACLEPAFYQQWLEVSGLADDQLPGQFDMPRWPELRTVFARTIAQRSRAEWANQLMGTDACAEVVLTMEEALHHPQLAARATLIDTDGLVHAGAAPRFSRTPGVAGGAPVTAGADFLESWGVQSATQAAARASGAVPS